MVDETNKGLLTMLLSLWKVWVLLIVVVLIKIFADEWFPRYLKKKKFSNWSSAKNILGKLKKLNPNDFENYIADLYSKLGYKTEKVGGSYDGGVDVIAEKDSIKHYIQCKNI